MKIYVRKGSELYVELHFHLSNKINTVFFNANTDANNLAIKDETLKY